MGLTEEKRFVVEVALAELHFAAVAVAEPPVFAVDWRA